ncbi:MAG: hypothetical protein AAGJ08_25450 [Cyanobacteria bacterium P01_H01_bin.35]
MNHLKQTTLINPAFLAGFMLALLLVSTPIIMASTFSKGVDEVGITE